MTDRIIKTYTIEFNSQGLVRRFERFLALLHFNSSFGHTGLFAMPLDGDGSDSILCNGQLDPALGYEVSLIGDVGGDVEIALEDGYRCSRVASDLGRYSVKPSATMYKDGEAHRTEPKTIGYSDPGIQEEK